MDGIVRDGILFMKTMKPLFDKMLMLFSESQVEKC